jgi:hypothetical protein
MRKLNPSITLNEMSIGFINQIMFVAIINVDYVVALDIKEASHKTKIYYKIY